MVGLLQGLHFLHLGLTSFTVTDSTPLTFPQLMGAFFYLLLFVVLLKKAATRLGTHRYFMQVGAGGSLVASVACVLEGIPHSFWGISPEWLQGGAMLALIPAMYVLYRGSTKNEFSPPLPAVPTKSRNMLLDPEDYEFLANSIPQLIWVADGNGNGIYYNDNWADYTGKRIEELMGNAWVDLLHQGDLDRCAVVWGQSVRTGSSYEIEYQLRNASGEYRWFLARGIPMKDENGQIKRWFGTCTDVHDFKRMQEEAKKTQHNLETLINTAPVAIWSVNKAGYFTLSEGKALQLVGTKPGERVGKPHSEVFASRPDLHKKVQRALDGESFMAINTIGNLTFETYYMPLFADDGTIDGMVGVSLDVTQRESAQTANAMKSRFLANMSHEIRTPLNAVLGFAEVLKKTNLDKEQLEYVGLINQSGELLLKLIGDVLDMSRIEEGKLPIEQKPFQLKETVVAALAPYQMRSLGKEMVFNLVYDENIPAILVGDAARIAQVLVNLVGNALKFTSKGRIDVGLQLVGTKPQLANIKFYVADSGIGIAKEQQRMIFDSFTQADSSTVKQYGGSGLGLSIVQELVHLMGGEVYVESPHQVFPCVSGSCFSFFLHLPIGEEKEQARSEAEQVHGFHNQLKVLVVEDNEVNQILAKLVLRNIGCQVEFANNGKECLEMLKKNDYSCILMDIQMPVMDGLDATRFIRNQMNNSIPIIGLSANVYKEDIDNSLQAGMNAHIGKPYTEEQIYQELKKWQPAMPKVKLKVEERVSDLQFVRSLAEDQEQLLTLLSKSFSQTQDYSQRMQQAFEQQDWDTLSFVAHTYKSSARIVGATQLQLKLDEVEKAVRTGKSAELATLHEEAMALSSTLGVELQAELGRLQGINS